MPETQQQSPSQDLSNPRKTLLDKYLQRARENVTTSFASGSSGIKPRSRNPEDLIPLSYAQEQIWVLDQINPGQSMYNLYQALHIHGPINQTALVNSFNKIIQRHEVLRTNFDVIKGRPVQIISCERTLDPQIIDLQLNSVQERETELNRHLQSETAKPFDLTRDSLLRINLYKLSSNEHVLLITMHHIISDGWSLNILFQEWIKHYEAFRANQPPPLPELPIQYADYALWERTPEAKATLDTALTYWREQLGDGLPELDLPTDFPRPDSPNSRGSNRSLKIPTGLTHALKALSQNEGSTLFMTLISAFQTLLYRYSKQETITIGTCAAGRSKRAFEQLIGFFVNTLVFRGELGGNPTFRDLLSRTRKTTLGAFAHQELPFERLVQELKPERTPGRNPFFQVMFVLQSANQSLSEPRDLKMKPIELDNGTAKFDLILSITESEDELNAIIEYRSDLFHGDTIEGMLCHYKTLLESATRDPEIRVDELSLLTKSEQHFLIHEGNDTVKEYPRNHLVHQLFEKQVSNTPMATSLVMNDQALSYDELNRRANQLAHYLRDLGIGPDILVALCLERSVDMVVTLLAILKAGGAYISLDPAYPAERLAFMLQDSNAKVLITHDSLAHILPKVTKIQGVMPLTIRLNDQKKLIKGYSSENLIPVGTAENLAYVSYTSGSTGRPKGVCINHRSINRLVINTNYIQIHATDTLAQISNCAFDASTFEIWGALLNGARLTILPSSTVLSTPEDFASALKNHEVTTVFLTTALFNQMARETPDAFQTLKHVLFGGETANPELVRRVISAGGPQHLLHVYGPTETTTFATWMEVTRVVPNATTIPIGRAISNTTLYVLDAQLQPVPKGLPGELYIGGDGMACGYLNRPDLDKERFIPHPFSNAMGDKLYRTGDRVRRLHDGNIEFLGRFDRQVKLRGFRIELEEVEITLEAHPDIEQARVMVSHRDKGSCLVAYVVPCNTKSTSESKLRQYLKNKLPSYMVPAAIVMLPRFPLNANGKIDAHALPGFEEALHARESKYVPPRTDTERRLGEHWKEVLEVQRVGVHDNFFELGGHSLAGIQLFTRIEEEFGCKLPLSNLFHNPTLEELARQLSEKVGGPTNHSSLVELKSHGTLPPMIFIHGAGGGNLWAYTNIIPHLDSNQPVYALDSRAMQGLEEFTSVEVMAKNYLREIRAIQPRGPYYLGGYCFGGNVAYEIARQFESQGDTVAMVALLDTAPANGDYFRIPWWNPLFPLRFGMNTAYWLLDFIKQTPREQRRFVVRKIKAFAGKVARLAKGRQQDFDDIDLDEIIDVSLFPKAQLQVWKTHVVAVRNYKPGTYNGQVTLFRTRGQPFLCSFDPKFGWGKLALGGVEVVTLPGAHEMIFVDPYVQELGEQLQKCLKQAQARYPNESCTNGRGPS